MEAKQTQALKRLAKKLSAMRKTLRKDEREILDQMVLGGSAGEVQAHRKQASTFPIVFDGKAQGYVLWEGPEVEGHMISPMRATPAVTPRITPKVQS